MSPLSSDSNPILRMTSELFETPRRNVRCIEPRILSSKLDRKSSISFRSFCLSSKCFGADNEKIAMKIGTSDSVVDAGGRHHFGSWMTSTPRTFRTCSRRRQTSPTAAAVPKKVERINKPVAAVVVVTLTYFSLVL